MRFLKLTNAYDGKCIRVNMDNIESWLLMSREECKIINNFRFLNKTVLNGMTQRYFVEETPEEIDRMIVSIEEVYNI